MDDNFPENVGTGEVPEATVSKEESKPKYRITKENARQFALSSAAAKRRRKQARSEMLARLTSDLDLGEELVKAWKEHDMDQVSLIEKALRIVGLHHDQSDEARVQNLKVDANTKSDVKATLAAPSLNIQFVDAKKD